MIAETVKKRKAVRNPTLEEKLREGRSTLIQVLEQRFGPLSEKSRKKVESLDSVEAIVEMGGAIRTADSLGALGLD